MYFRFGLPKILSAKKKSTFFRGKTSTGESLRRAGTGTISITASYHNLWFIKIHKKFNEILQVQMSEMNRNQICQMNKQVFGPADAPSMNDSGINGCCLN